MLVKAIQKFPSLKDLIPSLNQNKIYIYPNLNGIGLGLFIFFCFLISVFYQINSGLLVSIIIFFIFFISIFVSHQNINNLEINFNKEYLLEAEQNEILNFQILNSTDEKKLNIDIVHNNKKIGNFNFKKKLTSLKLEYQNSIRGEFYLDKLILKSIYPFGVIRTKTNFYPKTKIIVYPKKIKPTDSLLSEFAISKNIKLDEFEGIDEYKYGDNYSKIAWKKSTIDKKYVKIFSDKKKISNSILDIDKFNHINFEQLLSNVVYIVKLYYANKANLTIKHKNKFFELDNNQQSLNQILKYLAYVKN